MRLAAGRILGVALLTLGIGAVALACDANLESFCYDGPCAVAGSGGSGGGTTSGGATTGSGGSGGGVVCSEDAADGDFPCDVFDVLVAKCHVCHNADHIKGAPIDLLTCDRFHEQDCGKSQTRFHIADSYVDIGFMPLAGSEPLTAGEKATLLGWLDGCALCVPAGSGCSGTAAAKACYE